MKVPVNQSNTVLNEQLNFRKCLKKAAEWKKKTQKSNWKKGKRLFKNIYADLELLALMKIIDARVIETECMTYTL